MTIFCWEFLDDSVIPRIDGRAPPDPIYPNLTPRATEPSCEYFRSAPNIGWGCPSLTDGELLSRKDKDPSWYLVQLSGLWWFSSCPSSVLYTRSLSPPACRIWVVNVSIST